MAVDKKRLLSQARKMFASAEQEKAEARQAVLAQIEDVKQQLEAVRTQVDALRNLQGSERARFEAVKAERAALTEQLMLLEEELDGTAERRRLEAAMDAAKANYEVEKATRKKLFVRQAKEAFLKTPAASRPVTHPAGWLTSQPHGLIHRPTQPLGQSFPAEGRLEWTRFDSRPQVPWRVASGPVLFSAPTSLGTGLDPSSSTPAYVPPKPLPPHVLKHPKPFMPAQPTTLFSRAPADPAPGTQERRDIGKSAILDRVLYHPRQHGKPEWAPAAPHSLLLSVPVAENQFLREQAEVRERELMRKFGLGPGGKGVLLGHGDDDDDEGGRE